MHRFKSWIRRPVRRTGSDTYLLITLLSFAGSVILTRLFLELTGYPQIGGQVYHIAHVLWGGLLLFLAALLPLVAANRWVYPVSACLAGLGVGLFIDEVGKFITQTNDYFHPLAAPIVYALFLLTTMLYLRVRRPPTRSTRAELYRALEMMEEVLEHDLDHRERQELEARLREVAAQAEVEGDPVYTRLAHDLLDFLYYESLAVKPEPVTFWTRLRQRWDQFESKWLTRRRLKAILAGGLLALGLTALVRMYQTFPFQVLNLSLEGRIEDSILSGQLEAATALGWFTVRLVLDTTVGLLLMVAAGLLIAGLDRPAVHLGYLALLLSLAAINLLVFYFDQFSAVITATIQFWLLVGALYYRRRFLSS